MGSSWRAGDRSMIAVAITFSPVVRAICAARFSGALPWRLELNPAMIVMAPPSGAGRRGHDVGDRHVVFGTCAVDDVEALPHRFLSGQRRDDDLVRVELRDGSGQRAQRAGVAD